MPALSSEGIVIMVKRPRYKLVDLRESNEETGVELCLLLPNSPDFASRIRRSLNLYYVEVMRNLPWYDKGYDTHTKNWKITTTCDSTSLKIDARKGLKLFYFCRL